MNNASSTDPIGTRTVSTLFPDPGLLPVGSVERVKVIVEIHDGIDRVIALRQVADVVAMGPISSTAGKPHCCHATTFKDGTVVFVHPNRKSERFIVMKDKNPCTT